MTIAFLLQDTGAVYGAERATLDLAAGLAREGVRVVLILIRELRLGIAHSALDASARATGLDVQVVETAGRFSLRLVRDIRRVLVGRGADILHTVGYKADVHGMLATGSRIPQVSTVHGWLFRSDAKERCYGWINVQALRRCRSVVVLSRYYEDLLRRRGVRVERIPSGLDPADFPQESSHHGTFTVGLMGRFSEEKNHAMLLNAVKRVVESRVTVDVLLAGDGPLRPSVEAEIARLDLRHIVRLKGYVAREDFLGSIDVLILCSHMENLPYSVMEAMASGLPVIATRVGGLPDLVVDGETGFLVESNDAAALADRISKLAADRALRQRMGQAGRRKIEAEFLAGASVKSHLDLYARCLKG